MIYNKKEPLGVLFESVMIVIEYWFKLIVKMFFLNVIQQI